MILTGCLTSCSSWCTVRVSPLSTQCGHSHRTSAPYKATTIYEHLARFGIGAARGLQPHRAVASAIADSYLAWVASRLEPQSDGVPPLSPALFLATIQGMYSLTAIGRPAVAKTAMIELSACV